MKHYKNFCLLEGVASNLVTRSVDNWLKHLVDVYTKTKDEYSPEFAMKFIAFYIDRYDEFGRSFLDYKLAFFLTDIYYEAKRCGTRWFAALGIGGAGKTTIMKNAFYYLDPTIKNNQTEMIVTDIKHYLKALKDIPQDSLKALFLDEPDDEVHHQSKSGKVLRKVLGKQRQHGIFTGICATDVTDIPAYIWKKINVLFFCPFHGQVWLFINEPRKLKFPIQKIRAEIIQYGYDLLVSMRRYAYIFNSHAATPLDSEATEYISRKWEDYHNDIEEGLKMVSDKGKQPNEQLERNLKIKALYDEGFTPTQLSKKFGITRQRIHKIVK